MTFRLKDRVRVDATKTNAWFAGEPDTVVGVNPSTTEVKFDTHWRPIEMLNEFLILIERPTAEIDGEKEA